ncbi:ATP dependent DNA ligase [Rhodococcus qingshengii]|uniref:ATP dependent DNA ligase n=1 Tax=Rhodococcus qingshengii TaxID=334542 RepID=UPI00360110E4
MRRSSRISRSRIPRTRSLPPLHQRGETSPDSKLRSQSPGLTPLVRPLLVCDVEYREYTGGGLRHPAFKAMRMDKTADEVDLPGRH